MGAGGNGKSKSADMSQFGWLFVQTHKGSYFPGETVTGVLHVNLVKQFPGSKIVLKFKGKEYVFFTYITRSGKHSHTHHVTGVEPVVNYEIPVFETPGQDLQPGQFSIPFAIKLPSVLPGSFFLSRYHICAVISYHMEAVIKQTGTPNRLKFRGRIFIREPPQLMASMIPRQIDKKLVTCCCCNHGSVFMNVLFEKNSYTPGEICRATVNLDLSKTSEEVRDLILTVRQYVDIQPNGRNFSRQFSIMAQTLPGPKKGEKLENHPMEFQLPVAEMGDIWDVPRQDVWNYLRSTPFAGAFATVNNSTSGRIVRSRFDIEVDVIFRTCCCPLFAKAEVPIDIHASEVMPMALPPPPQNWTPKLLPEQDYLNPTQYFTKGQQNLNNFSGVNPLMTPMTGNQVMPTGQNQNMVGTNQNMMNPQVGHAPQVSNPNQQQGYQPVPTTNTANNNGQQQFGNNYYAK